MAKPDVIFLFMANELPYFRFTVQAWQNGKIDIERNELKGIYISICGYYWIQDCSITLAMLKKKFPNDVFLIEELINLDIIKHEKRHDKVEIEFLNSQYDLLSEKRKRRQGAGSKGGNAKAKLKQNSTYNDKDNNKDNDKDKDNKREISKSKMKVELVYPYHSEEFMNLWNILTNEPKWKKKSLTALQSNLHTLSQLSEKDALNAMKTALNSGWQGIFPPKNANLGQNVKIASKTEQMNSAYNNALTKIENANTNNE